MRIGLDNRHKKPKTIGVLGGVGPSATADFYMELRKEAQTKYNAKLNEDFPAIYIYNLPLPYVVGGGTNRRVLSFLLAGIKKLDSWKPDLIAIPCNTANIFFREMKKSVKAQLLNIVEETLKDVNRSAFKKVGLLATSETIKDKLYASKKVKIIAPSKEDQQIIDKIVLRINAGNQTKKDKEKILKIIAKFEKNGINAIICGCTEIPLILKQEDTKCTLFNSTTILARAAIKMAYRK